MKNFFPFLSLFSSFTCCFLPIFSDAVAVAVAVAFPGRIAFAFVCRLLAHLCESSSLELFSCGPEGEVTEEEKFALLTRAWQLKRQTHKKKDHS